MRHTTKNIALFSMLAMTLVCLSVLSISDVFGWHDYGQKKWATSNNAYLCKPSLNIITYEFINPCNEAKKAANNWTNVSGSSWTLTFTSGSSAPIHLISGQASHDDYIAESKFGLDTTHTYINGADIKFDLDHGFTDVSNGASNASYYDFESIALHEFGHVQWVDHSVLNFDSVMQKNIAPDTMRDTPETHDKDVLKSRYPQQ